MNIYCFSTLSFAKLQFKSVINKAFHKHGVASFTDAWIETLPLCLNLISAPSHLLQMRGLKPLATSLVVPHLLSHLLQMRGLKLCHNGTKLNVTMSHLLQMRGLKPNSVQRYNMFLKSHLLQMRGLKPYRLRLSR